MHEYVAPDFCSSIDSEYMNVALILFPRNIWHARFKLTIVNFLFQPIPSRSYFTEVIRIPVFNLKELPKLYEYVPTLTLIVRFHHNFRRWIFIPLVPAVDGRHFVVRGILWWTILEAWVKNKY